MGLQHFERLGAWLAGALLLIPALVAAQTPLTHERIAFVSVDRTAHTSALNIVDPDGGNLLPLVVDGHFLYPTWSPDGTQLAFIGRVRDFDPPTLWVINSDGTNLHRVLPDVRTSPDAECAAWSPDGTQFVIGENDGAGGNALFTVNADGSGLTRLRVTGLPSGMEGVSGRVGEPCANWTPTGTGLVLLADSADLSGWQPWLWAMDGSGAVAFPGTLPQRYTLRVAWSPDANHTLIYAPLPNDGAFPVDTMTVASADGSVVEAVIGPPARYPGSASWSPDSRRLAFVALEQGGDVMPAGDLWIADADGTTITPLNLGIEVWQVGTSWAAIPGDIVLPTAPVSLAEAAG